MPDTAARTSGRTDALRLMHTARQAHANAPGPTGLASWYVPARADGFGDRLLMFDNTSTPSLELLRFRPELRATPGFEDALRDRVRELDRFRHEIFSPVRAVQYLDDGNTLALVSVHAPGQRLAEMFDQQPRKGLNPAIVSWMLRELTPERFEGLECRCGIRRLPVTRRKLHVLVQAQGGERRVEVGGLHVCREQRHHVGIALAARHRYEVAPDTLAELEILDFVQLGESRRDARFDRALAQQARTERVDGAREEALEIRERVPEARNGVGGNCPELARPG